MAVVILTECYTIAIAAALLNLHHFLSVPHWRCLWCLHPSPPGVVCCPYGLRQQQLLLLHQQLLPGLVPAVVGGSVNTSLILRTWWMNVL